MKDVESCDLLPGAMVTATLSTGVNETKYQPNWLNGHIKLHDCHQSKAKLFAEKAGYCSVIDEVKIGKDWRGKYKGLVHEETSRYGLFYSTLTILKVIFNRC